MNEIALKFCVWHTRLFIQRRGYTVFTPDDPIRSEKRA